ncbi:MAG TPA: hypothetical protein PKW90_28435, partial [Myxococcota bacterium]|nr:hypothetical protein [Myxococcota bacterium]
MESGVQPTAAHGVRLSVGPGEPGQQSHVGLDVCSLSTSLVQGLILIWMAAKSHGTERGLGLCADGCRHMTIGRAQLDGRDHPDLLDAWVQLRYFPRVRTTGVPQGVGQPRHDNPTLDHFINGTLKGVSLAASAGQSDG